MKNAPTFEFPIFLTKRQYLRGKIRARTTVVQIATIRGLKNVEKRRLYLYGLSVKKKKKKNCVEFALTRNTIPPQHIEFDDNSNYSIICERWDAQKRRDLVDSIVFFHGLFFKRKGLERILRCVPFVPVSTSDDP